MVINIKLFSLTMDIIAATFVSTEGGSKSSYGK